MEFLNIPSTPCFTLEEEMMKVIALTAKRLVAKITGRHRAQFETRTGGWMSAEILRTNGRMVALRRGRHGPVFYRLITA